MSAWADWVVYGGSAGGGKSWGLIYEPLRHKENARFRGLLLRRTYAQIANPGGLLDESREMYKRAGGSFNTTGMAWTFRSGAQVKFGNLQHGGDEENYQGAQLAYIGFDEATHFSEQQIFYMASRNRSVAGVKPYMRLTCNPDADSWLAKFLDWWIGADGFPLAERAGIVRWFVRHKGEIVWADAPEQLAGRFGADTRPLSATFIPALLQDNAILMKANPEYLASLQALPLVEQMRLLYGNWKVRAEAGKVFNRDWFDILPEAGIPQDGVECRFFDFASSTRQVAGADPDYTATVRLRRFGNTFYVMHAHQERVPPAQHEGYMRTWIDEDLRRAANTPIRYMVRWEIEPGSAAQRETWRMVSAFAGLDAMGIAPQGDKLTRAKPLAAQAYVGNVKLAQGGWNEEYLTHMHHQPDWPHDDLMDASSGAFNAVAGAGQGDVAVLAQAFNFLG